MAAAPVAQFAETLSANSAPEEVKVSPVRKPMPPCTGQRFSCWATGTELAAGRSKTGASKCRVPVRLICRALYPYTPNEAEPDIFSGKSLTDGNRLAKIPGSDVTSSPSASTVMVREPNRLDD